MSSCTLITTQKVVRQFKGLVYHFVKWLISVDVAGLMNDLHFNAGLRVLLWMHVLKNTPCGTRIARFERFAAKTTTEKKEGGRKYGERKTTREGQIER